MLAEFESVESLVPRPASIELFNCHAAGLITVTPLMLRDGGSPPTRKLPFM
jgi:hypothetical protein